jgi:hypothetical protein
MPLTIDLAAAARRLSDDEFFAWAQGQTVFLSSVMNEFEQERRALAAALEGLGVTVRWFEDFGGRDDSAADAYLGEVRSATIYLGLLGDSYGNMLNAGEYQGYSATHAEYLEARARGKRITFWERRPADRREGHARKFLDEVWVFQVTGRFENADDLVAGVEKRLREMAAEDLAPWVKVGDVIIRAAHVQASADELILRTRVYDPAVLRALNELAGQGWRQTEVPVTYGNRSGTGHVEKLAESSTSGAFTAVELTAKVNWADRGDTGAAGTSGYSPEDLTEVAVRVGLLGEPMPANLQQMSFLVAAEDPLAELQAMHVPEGSIQALSRLLVVENLVGSRRASGVERFIIGPPRNHQRHVEIAWWEPRRYSSVEPQLRHVSAVRPWS